ncbi:uncharacterized protein LOC104582336 [Brachypodium distachyon]|uniref:uncharacterized protein LOC104582336 n=1 Tax=Brachypodium distachyon TaxID=15368 RepID=UPI00052FFF34|nr:uncharacterized protein LOC104582336 [Brachypodium distachyon]|eukprot:XP_010230101.1 uncharacterized protein LOC104582336 [Brachypodium distachyon]
MAPLSLDLPDELIHEILFRLQPDELALLVWHFILSKSWDRLLSDPAFHHRYRKLRQMAPTLGFIYSGYSIYTKIATSFVPAMGFCPPSIPNYKLPDFAVSDCRHSHGLGRVFPFQGFVHMELVVWNPLTGHHTQFNSFNDFFICMGEEVLCPVDGCDHATCHDFHVVCVGINQEESTTTAIVYSSQTDEWSAPTPGLQLNGYDIETHNVLVGGALYFLLTYGPHGTQILKYDIGRNRPGHYPHGTGGWRATDRSPEHTQHLLVDEESGS